MSIFPLPTAALLALALAACARETDVDALNEIDNDFVEVAAPENVQAVPPNYGNETPPDIGNGAVGEGDTARPFQPMPGVAAIPTHYHGRWGIVANDCQPGRSDAKGLITIGDSNVRFYESVATLKERRPSIATSFSGLFAFTGEGQSWEKIMTFTRTGDTLVRAEDGGRFTYRRCT